MELITTEERLHLGNVTLPADVTLPTPTARAVVVFAHGSGSSRRSARNRQVAATLQEAGFATVLFDLLTEGEGVDRRNVFDIALLAERLAGVVDVVGADERLAGLPIGLFGASTGAAAALDAAARRPEQVAAVVSRGGRPDLAAHPGEVRVPVLLLVGGEDHAVLELNQQAARQLGGPHELVVVPGAGHLFEGPGQLETVAEHARRWFAEHLRG